MQEGAFALFLLAAAASWEPPPPPSPAAPEGLAQLEGRGLGAPGSAAAELAAGGIPLRFAAPAGGAGELVLYLASVPDGSALRLRQRTALASLLGVPGEVRLAERPARPARNEPASLDVAPQPVPEPAAGALVLLGLGGLARLARRRTACQAAGRWSGRPPG
jgi:MYXO-CTERM domain-containing protein